MEYELNFRDYLRIFDKRKWVIALAVVSSIIIGMFYLQRQVPIYEANCRVKFIEEAPMYSPITGAFSHSRAMVSMQMEANTVTSYDILEKSARKLGLIKEGALKDEIDSIVTSLKSKIIVSLVEQTSFLDIRAVSSDPKQAMVLAYTVARVYQEWNLEERKKSSSTVREFIESQLKTVEGNLFKAETKLRDFRSQEGSVGEIAAPLQEKLVNLEFEHAKLLQKYTEEHPKIIEIKEQINDIQKQLSSYSDQTLRFSQLQRDVEVNRKLFGLLKEKFEEARIVEAAKIGSVTIVDPPILPASPISPDRNRIITISAVFGLLVGFALSFLLENLDTSIGTVEDVESITKLPVLAVVPRITLDRRQKLKFFSAPFNKKDSCKNEAAVRMTVHYRPDSNEAEAYRILRTNLKIDKERKLFTVTSAGPKEGKTTVLINLGLATAQAGLKTLLVSTDLRRPAIYKTFNIVPEPGFYEVITKGISWNKAIRSITDFMLSNIGLEDALKTRGLDNLYILTSGHMVSNPSEILSSSNLKPLKEELKDNFDVIFFDSPPVLPLSDALLLSNISDGVILVYESGRTSRDALMRAKIQLEGYGAKVVGIVMNQIKPQLASYPSYRYYYSKYKYSSQEKKAPS